PWGRVWPARGALRGSGRGALASGALRMGLPLPLAPHTRTRLRRRSGERTARRPVTGSARSPVTRVASTTPCSPSASAEDLRVTAGVGGVVVFQFVLAHHLLVGSHPGSPSLGVLGLEGGLGVPPLPSLSDRTGKG